MAINPGTLYPTRTTAASPDYPWGGSKDETSEGAADGTPHAELRSNDVFGLHQALLFQLGINPTGNPDTAIDSQYIESMIRLISTGGLYIDSGAADAYVLATTGDVQDSKGYFDGQRAGFYAANANAGASTVNISTLGDKDVRQVGGAVLTASMIRTDRLNYIRYNASAGYFELEDSGILNRITAVENVIAPFSTAISGLGISNGAAIVNLDIAPGAAADTSSGTSIIRLSTALTKRIDQDWTAGDNNGGFPSALTLTSATWYGVFVIGKADGTTVDVGFDTSPIAANLLLDATDYVNYRRIAFIYYVDGTDGISPFLQRGDIFTWKTPVIDADALSWSLTRVLTSLTVPPLTGEITALGDVSGQIDSDAVMFYGVISSDLTPDIVPSSGSYTFRLSHDEDGTFSIRFEIPTDTGQLGVRTDNVGIGTSDYSILTHGWSDTRGK